MDENWMALLVAIMSNCGADKAFSKLTSSGISKKVGIRMYCDIEGILKLREQGLTYYQIGCQYGVTAACIFSRVKKYKEREAVAQ